MPIALACDMRFASDRAVFTTAFARRGLIAEWGISWMLPRLVGTAHAMDLLLSARKVEAAEAERMGLVNRVIPHDELMEATRAYAIDMAEHCAPGSLAVIKRQLYEDWTLQLADAEQGAMKRMLESFGRSDFAEGVQSFLERRSPKFGRIGS
jgi:enoyl-CoA hydratase/carnithine racemase